MIHPKKFITQYPLTAFFSLTFLMVWLGMAANISGRFPAFGEWPVSVDGYLTAVFRTRLTLMNWFPNLAALIVLGIASGWSSVRELFAGFFKWRVGAGAWMAALLLPLLAAGLTVGIYCLTGKDIDLGYITYVPVVLFIRFVFALSAESIGGEAGWRGFAQECLQKKYSPLAASMIVGIFWGLCHLPIITVRGFDVFEMGAFMGIILCLSVILAWIYNRTQGSLMLVAVVHALFDALFATCALNFTALLPRKEFMVILMGILIAIALILSLTTQGQLGVKET